MPSNKNPYIRYKALDECFKDNQQFYYMEDLIKACCDALEEVNGSYGAKGAEGVKRRQIYNDMHDMERIFGVCIEKIRDGKQMYYKYEKGSKHIGDAAIMPQEKEAISQAIQVLKRFEGAPHLDWLNDTINSLYASSHLKSNTVHAVSYQNNPYLKGMDKWFRPAFDAIVGRRVIAITYHPFNRPEKQLTVSPYQLKQYNNRWFLIGKIAGKDGLANFAIDRIQDIKRGKGKYEPLPRGFKFETHFADVVGVSVEPNVPVEDVVLHVHDKSIRYIESKPLHPSQSKSRKLEDGRWEVTLRVKDNYELRSLLRSFGDGLEVVAPASLREKMKREIDSMAALYQDGENS